MRWLCLAFAVLVVALASSCGGSGAATGAAGGGSTHQGGVLHAAMPANPDHLDPGLSYTPEGWEILEATNNGLLTFRKASGGAGSEIVPDIASAMPRVSDGGLTYTFHLRSDVRFSPPVNRPVRASDFKYTIQRLFRINSGGLAFYTDIAGATAYEAKKAASISGITANDSTGTLVFHLVHPDGTFLDYLAVPFAFVVPAGTPMTDTSTVARWRIATGPYRISSYTPAQQIVLTRNPNFHSWTPNTPDGHVSSITIQIGVTPEQSVNLTADGSLDWYFENIPTDRYTELRTRYPNQVSTTTQGEIEYFNMNERLYPFTKLAVRQAVNYASNRAAMVKIEGGQGSPTENIIPPSFGSAYKKHTFYPYDPAKARALVRQAGAEGAQVTVWGDNVDPAPQLVQYEASVLDSIGLKASVKILDSGVYWDLMSTQKGDGQMAYNNWFQDFPEGEDFFDVLLNGQNIQRIGNNNWSNASVPAYDALIDKAKQMPLGPARNAIWAQLDAAYTKNNAPWLVFMNATHTRYFSTRVHGLVINPNYGALFPEMWLG